MKVINLESTFNTRDLSSLKIENKRIKENRLIRSGHLHNLTENDVNTLKNYDDTLSINDLYDLIK